VVDWSGWIPEDISYLHLKDYFSRMKLLMHYGDEDKFLTDKNVKGIQDVIDSNQLNVQVSTFQGKHHIPKPELIRFFEEHDLR